MQLLHTWGPQAVLTHRLRDVMNGGGSSQRILVTALQAQPIDQLPFILPRLDHRGDEIVGDCVDRGDSGKAVPGHQPEPDTQPSIRGGTLQRRIAADKLHLVQQQAPTGETGSLQQQGYEADALFHQGGSAGQAQVEQAPRAHRRQALADRRGAHASAGQKPFKPPDQIGWRRGAAQQMKDRLEHPGQVLIGRADGNFKPVEPVGHVPQHQQGGADRIVVAARQHGAPHRSLKQAAGIGQRRFLADHHAGDSEVMGLRNFTEIAQEV